MGIGMNFTSWKRWCRPQGSDSYISYAFAYEFLLFMFPDVAVGRTFSTQSRQ